MNHIKLMISIVFISILKSLPVYSQPAWTWENNYGGTKDEFSSCVKTDNSGNIFITGTFESTTLTFGTSTVSLKTNSRKDIFLTKINSSGTVLWSKSIGAYDPDGGCNLNYNYSTCLTIDNSGNCYIAGMFESDTLYFAPTIKLSKACETADADIFIAKYDSNGNALWAKKYGGSDWDKVTDICTDNLGNVIVSGTFWSSAINFDSYVLTNTTGSNAFIVKLNSSGNALWARCSTGNLGNYGTCIAVDNNNNIVVGGSFQSATISFGTQTLTNTGMWDLFLAKYDSNGNIIWAKKASGAKSDFLFALKIDNTGNIYITGRFISEQLTFGSLPSLINSGGGYSYDVFIAKFDSNGFALWSKGFGGDKEENGLSLTIDNSSNLLISGLYESNSLSFDSYVLNKSGQRNMFIAKLDQNSNVLWAVSSTGNNKDNINCITSDNAGNNYLFGSFSSNFSIGTYNLTSSGLSDVYLIKFQ
jgi:hypothetical protein